MTMVWKNEMHGSSVQFQFVSCLQFNIYLWSIEIDSFLNSNPNQLLMLIFTDIQTKHRLYALILASPLNSFLDISSLFG